MSTKIPVGILGATGMVGQRFIQLLENHPWFKITFLGASERSANKPYIEAVEGRWKMDTDIPSRITSMPVNTCQANQAQCRFVFSGLDSNVAESIEKDFAQNGIPVISNSRNHRYDPDIPLLVPEVNPDHLEAIPIQQKNRGWDGFIITNPNCVAIPLALALKPIQTAVGITKVLMVSMQAISGAGYPGLPSYDILDNIIPFIGGEEPKVIQEPQKILGNFDGQQFNNAEITIAPHCNRVNTRDGHLLCISFSTQEKTSVAEITHLLKDFTSEPQKLNLPSAPQPPIIVRQEENRPQTRFDRQAKQGMAISVGRIRECELLDYKMVVLGHNTIRGAAGAAILNAELLKAKGFL